MKRAGTSTAAVLSVLRRHGLAMNETGVKALAVLTAFEVTHNPRLALSHRFEDEFYRHSADVKDRSTQPAVQAGADL